MIGVYTNLVSHQIYHRIDGILFASSKFGQHGWFLPPQGFRPEGEILRRHSCSSRVYRGKYLQLKKGVNIPEKSLDLLERGPPGIVE